MRSGRTPSWERMIPFTHSLPPSACGIVLPAREPLLLHCAHRLSVDQERGSGIVVVRGNAEDAHQYWLVRGVGRRAPENPSGSFLAARFARSANTGSSKKYWRARKTCPKTAARAAATRR